MTDEDFERELKFSTSDLEKLRDRLVDIEAERIAASAFEDNLVFDRDGTLATEGCLLRMRLDRHGARVTFKGPAHFDGNMKVRKEFETRVTEGKQFEKILKALGYKLVRRYQKMREECHDLFANGKAHTGPFYLQIEPLKRLKNKVCILILDAYAIIFHGNLNKPLFLHSG